MDNTGDEIRQMRINKQIERYKELRADENVYSIGGTPPSGPFVYFCGTFTSHGLAIYQPWMVELRHLLRKKGYTHPICLPDERLSISKEVLRIGVVWQNKMIAAATDIVFSLEHMSHQEEVLTSATLGMVLARMEYAADHDKNVYVYDRRQTVSCLQLRYRLGAAGMETYHSWPNVAKAIVKNQS